MYELNFCLYLTQTEHEIVASKIQEYCEGHNLKLGHYEQLPVHIPCYRRVLITGNKQDLAAVKVFVQEELKCTLHQNPAVSEKYTITTPREYSWSAKFNSREAIELTITCDNAKLYQGQYITAELSKEYFEKFRDMSLKISTWPGIRNNLSFPTWELYTSFGEFSYVAGSILCVNTTFPEVFDVESESEITYGEFLKKEAEILEKK